MDDDKVAALRAKLAARKVPTAKKAAVKKLAAKSRARVVEAEEPAGQVLGRVIRGTTHATIFATCVNSKCREYKDQKMIRVPMLSTVILMPGHIICAGCMRDMTWTRGDGVHVDREPT